MLSSFRRNMVTFCLSGLAFIRFWFTIDRTKLQETEIMLLKELYPFILYTLFALLIVGGLLTAAWWLGSRTTCPNKELPYESGIIPSGSARLAQQVPFYLIAIFFIVFDVETAFIFTWAVAWDRLGMAGLLHITFFIVALLVGLVWLWIKGGLEWGPSMQVRGTMNEALRIRQLNHEPRTSNLFSDKTDYDEE